MNKTSQRTMKILPRTGYWKTLWYLVRDPDHLIKQTLQYIMEHEYKVAAPLEELKFEIGKSWGIKRRFAYFINAIFEPNKFHTKWETEIREICVEQLIMPDLNNFINENAD